jgi:hypothetical protein
VVRAGPDLCRESSKCIQDGEPIPKLLVTLGRGDASTLKSFLFKFESLLAQRTDVAFDEAGLRFDCRRPHEGMRVVKHRNVDPPCQPLSAAIRITPCELMKVG